MKLSGGWQRTDHRSDIGYRPPPHCLWNEFQNDMSHLLPSPTSHFSPPPHPPSYRCPILAIQFSDDADDEDDDTVVVVLNRNATWRTLSTQVSRKQRRRGVFRLQSRPPGGVVVCGVMTSSDPSNDRLIVGGRSSIGGAGNFTRVQNDGRMRSADNRHEDITS